MKFLLVDSSRPDCQFILADEAGMRQEYSWSADRRLARDLLKESTAFLKQCGLSLKQLDGIGVFKGPGSYTGLRIGLAVLNTLASELDIGIVGATDPDWAECARSRLAAGDNEQIVLPYYGNDVKITTPRK